MNTFKLNRKLAIVGLLLANLAQADRVDSAEHGLLRKTTTKPNAKVPSPSTAPNVLPDVFKIPSKLERTEIPMEGYEGWNRLNREPLQYPPDEQCPTKIDVNPWDSPDCVAAGKRYIDACQTQRSNCTDADFCREKVEVCRAHFPANSAERCQNLNSCMNECKFSFENNYCASKAKPNAEGNYPVCPRAHENLRSAFSYCYAYEQSCELAQERLSSERHNWMQACGYRQKI